MAMASFVARYNMGHLFTIGALILITRFVFALGAHL